MSSKLEKIPEERNENDIKPNEEGKKVELNNEKEKINEAINIELNKEEVDDKNILKNKNFILNVM